MNAQATHQVRQPRHVRLIPLDGYSVSRPALSSALVALLTWNVKPALTPPLPVLLLTWNLALAGRPAPGQAGFRREPALYIHGRCQKAGVGKQIQPTRRAAGLGERDWWRSGPGSHHQQYVQRGTPRTSFADPACGLSATHEPLQQFCDGASASPTLSPGNGTFAPSWSPTLPPGNGTSVSCELYYFTLVRALPSCPGVACSRAFAELHAVCAPNLLGSFPLVYLWH